MEIHTREAVVTDAPAIIAFQQLMARETESIELDEPAVGRGVHAVFGDRSRGRYFVAEAEGRVIASLLITDEWSDWRDAPAPGRAAEGGSGHTQPGALPGAAAATHNPDFFNSLSGSRGSYNRVSARAASFFERAIFSSAVPAPPTETRSTVLPRRTYSAPARRLPLQTAASPMPETGRGASLSPS